MKFIVCYKVFFVFTISYDFHMVQAVSLREIEDVALLEEKLGRSLSKEERSRIGVSRLRLFLEELLQKRCQ